MLPQLSKDVFFEFLILQIQGILNLVLPFFIYALIFVTFVKLINTALCKKFINDIMCLLDIVVLAICVVIFMLNVSLLSWIAICASIMNFIFAAVFSYAEL